MFDSLVESAIVAAGVDWSSGSSEFRAEVFQRVVQPVTGVDSVVWVLPLGLSASSLKVVLYTTARFCVPMTDVDVLEKSVEALCSACTDMSHHVSLRVSELERGNVLLVESPDVNFRTADGNFEIFVCCRAAIVRAATEAERKDSR